MRPLVQKCLAQNFRLTARLRFQGLAGVVLTLQHDPRLRLNPAV